MTLKRPLITTIDSIVAMLSDYTAGQIPRDARAVTLRINPHERGLLGIVVDSDNWQEPGTGAVNVKFEIRRVYSAHPGASNDS